MITLNYKSITASRFILMLLFIGALYNTQSHGQSFSANVRVNNITAGDQNTDGGNSLAVYGDNIYALWTDWDGLMTYVSKSIDGGATFGDGVPVASAGPQLFPALAVNDAGDICVAWCGGDIENEIINGIYFAKSTDGGSTFSDPVIVNAEGAMPKMACYGNNVYVFFVMSDTNQIGDYYFTRSVNGGSTFEAPYKINDAEQQVTRWEDMNSLYVDASGNLYAAWNDGRNSGKGQDIYMAKSTNDGASFGANVPVSLMSPLSVSLDRIGSSVAVINSDVYIAWRMIFSDDHRAIAFSKSTDGGAKFGAETIIDQGMCRSPSIAAHSSGDVYFAYPNLRTEGNGMFCFKSCDGCESFADSAYINEANADAAYPSIVIGDDGTVYALWSDNRTGNDDVYFSKGKFTVTGINDMPGIIPSDFSLYQNYPNPFNPETAIEYSIPYASQVELKVFDLLGNEVTTLVDKIQSAGTYRTVFNINLSENGSLLSSGIYYYQLRAGNFILQKKMMLLK